MNQHLQDKIRRYGVAVLSVVVVYLLWSFLPDLSRRYPFLLGFIPILLASAYGGLGPGILSAVLSAAIIEFLFLDPPFALSAEPLSIAGLLIYLGTSLFVAYFTAARKTAQEIDRANRRWFEVILASIGDGVVVTDSAGRINFMNQAAELLVGVKKSHAIGKPIPEVLRILNEGTRQPLDPIVLLANSRSVERLSEYLILVRPDLSERRVEFRAAEIKEDGELTGIIVILRDVQERRRAELALETSEERLRVALDAGNMGAWDWNIETGDVKWSDNLEKIHGLKPGSFGGTLDSFIEIIYPEDRAKVEKDFQGSLKTQEPFSTEFRVQWPDGTMHWMGGKGKAFTDHEGKPLRMMGVGFDLTNEKRKQNQMQFLAEASNLLSASLEPETTIRNLTQMIVPSFADWCRSTFLQEDGTVKTVGLYHQDANKQALLERLLQLYPPGPDDPVGPAHVAKTNQSVLLPEIPKEMLMKAAKNQEHLEMLVTLGAKSYMCVPLRGRERILGTIGFISSISGRVYKESDLTFAEDLAARAALAVDNARLYQESKKAQDVLLLQLRENKVLLREMNHRVKNNLQVISSLLRLQSRYAESPAQEILHESQNRIHAMALIHEKLYGSESLTKIDLNAYLKDLTKGLFDSYAVNQDKISLELSCEGEYLELDKAIPCGLLINEILTNSVKHAFPADRRGHVWVRFKDQGGHFFLELEDDGIGIPQDLDVENGPTLGLRLISNLVTQLHGKMNLERSHGTKFSIDFH